MSESTTYPVETIRRALTAYRVMAWATGLWLIALCYEMVMKYVMHVEGLNWIGFVHGQVYIVYLVCTFNLALKVRWPVPKTIGVLLAGTIPFAGIIVEQVQTREIREKYSL